MIVGYTDRMVRCYTWIPNSNSMNNNNNSLANNTKNSISKGSLVSQVTNNVSLLETGKISLDYAW